MARSTPIFLTLALAAGTFASAVPAQSNVDPPPAPSPATGAMAPAQGPVAPPPINGDPGGPGQGRQTQAAGSGEPGGGQGRQAQPLIPQSAADQPGPQPAPSGDPGGPGQGRQTQIALADLTPGAAITLGASAPIAWGTTATIPASAASRMLDGRCGFRVAYRVTNAGSGQAGASTSRLHRGMPNGPVLGTHAISALAPGASAPATGMLWLSPGTTLVYVKVDAVGQVTEANEPNNLRRVQVTVRGRCVPA